jgi:hypothetical protein
MSDDMDMTHTPDMPTSLGKGRMDKVPEYHGQRSMVDTWLLHCDLHFHVNDSIDSTDKAVLATTRLRGDAFSWVKPHLQRYMDDNDTDANITMMFEDWDEFKRQLRQVFGMHKSTIVAERKIQELRQVNSVADYANQFRQYATQIKWNDEALRHMFRKGLKPQVREELMRTSATTDTLEQLVDESIRLDNELYQLRLETAQYSGRGHQPNHGKRRQDYVRTTQVKRTAGYYTSNKPEEMHVDSVTREKTWKVENKKQKSKKDVVCYGCGKKGHFARDCRSKNKVTRHVNAIGHQVNGSEIDTEPWEIVATMEEGYNVWEPTWEDISNLDLGTEGSNSEDTESNKENIDPFNFHPGDRVHGSWDEQHSQNIQEEPDMDVRTKTMEGKRRNRRKTACISCHDRRIRCEPSHQVGTCQACHSGQRQCRRFPTGTLEPATTSIITQATPDDTKRVATRLRWETLKQLEKEGKTIAKCVPQGEDCGAIQYDQDYRNPTHAKLHYKACTYDYCDVHYSSKVQASYFPTPRGKCRWQWFDCQKDICRDHLWDKRTTNYFPGHTSQQIAIRNLTFNQCCQNEHWQTCMNTDCNIHRIQKEQNGFEENSFLERNKALNLNITSPPRSCSDQEGSGSAATSEQEPSRYE